MIDTSHPNATVEDRSGWFKASFSSNAASCVEVRFDGDLVRIRDSKYRRNPANDPACEPIIAVTPGDWMAFLGEVSGRAPAHTCGPLAYERAAGGATVLRSPDADVALTFSAAEWRAFVAGVQAREFDHPAVAANA
jgi:hypothetical protein